MAPGPNGTSAFAWAQAAAGRTQIHGRNLAAGGALSAAQPLSQAFREAYGQSIDTDAAGNAVVTGLVGAGPAAGVYARRRAADGSLSATQRLTPINSAVEFSGAKLAVEPDGDAVVV